MLARPTVAQGCRPGCRAGQVSLISEKFTLGFRVGRRLMGPSMATRTGANSWFSRASRLSRMNPMGMLQPAR